MSGTYLLAGRDVMEPPKIGDADFIWKIRRMRMQICHPIKIR